MEMRYAVAVVGGGASGMVAAIAAARQKPNGGVIVLERGARVGKKLLSTGNGRCNLTNREATAADYGPASGFVRSILERLSPDYIAEKFFVPIGLVCMTESEGRVYPYSEQASAVLDVLRMELQREGVVEQCSFEVTEIRREKGGFCLKSAEGEVRARRVILACGGAASPSCGGTAAGYALLRQVGHNVRKAYPLLVPVTTDWPRMKALKGVRCKAQVRLLTDGKTLAQEQGEVQFTENALSGICVFQLSRLVSRMAASGKLRKGSTQLAVDLFPGLSWEQLKKILAERKNRFWNLPAEQLLTGVLNKKIAYEILREAIPELSSRSGAEVTAEEWNRIVKMCKDWRFPVTGTADMKQAQVTGGGADCTEFDPESLESKKMRGLYACGEVLDVDGPCGGFNLQWAWSSGLAAGIAAGKAERSC